MVAKKKENNKLSRFDLNREIKEYGSDCRKYGLWRSKIQGNRKKLTVRLISGKFIFIFVLVQKNKIGI